MPPPSRRRGWRLPSAGTTRGSRKRTARVGLSSIAATNLRPAAANGPGSWSPTETLVDVGNADAARLNGTEQQRSELALPEPNPPFPRGGAWSLGECSVYRGTPGYWTCNSARHAPNGSWCEGHIAVALTGRSVCRSWRELPRRTRPPAVQANTPCTRTSRLFRGAPRKHRGLCWRSCPWPGNAGVVLVGEHVVYCAPSLGGAHGAPRRRLTVRQPGEAAMKQHAPRDDPQSRVTTHHPLE
jgi:hypothetical protein